jgi:acyl-CoA thioesterase-1
MTPPVFLDNGGWLHALAPKSTKPLHILAIGSSSTAGTGASSPSFTYPAQLRADLAGIWNIDAVVENAGIGGERATATLGRLEAELRVKPVDLVIWQVGTNDATSRETEATFRSAVERGVGVAHDAKVDVILLDPQFYPGIKDLARYERFVGIIGAVGAEKHVPLFSRYAMMKTWGAHARHVLARMQ